MAAFGWKAALREGATPPLRARTIRQMAYQGPFAHRNVAVLVRALVPVTDLSLPRTLRTARHYGDVLGRPPLVLSRSNRVLTLRRIL